MPMQYQGDPINTFMKGIGTGSDMFSKLMQPILQRENMARQWKEHQDNLANQQQAQARLQKQFEQQQQDRAMLNSMLGLDGSPGAGQGSPSTSPTMGYGEGAGMFSPGGLIRQQQSTSSAKPKIDMEMIINSPFGRAAFKKIYGIDPASETPAEKESREIRTTEEKEQKKLDVKERVALDKELPRTKELMGRIKDAIPLIKNNRDLFGPGIGGLDILLGPEQRYRGLKDPKKIRAAKTLKNLFAELQGQQAADFSSRALNVAFKLAGDAKTSMGDHPDAAIATLQNILKKMDTLHNEDLQRYEQSGGKSLHLRSPGTSKWDQYEVHE